MTDFKTIHGKKIKFLTSDLSMSTATEGELFYSDSDKEFKVGVNLAAFASGGNMGTARGGISGNVGTQTAGLFGGGEVPADPYGSVATEEYDGSSWTAGGNRNDEKFRVTNFGTQTAAVGFGGYLQTGTPAPQRYLTDSEEYDGSSWSESGAVNPNGIQGAAGTGTQTAGLSAGGGIGPAAGAAGLTAESYEYDGSSWSAGGDLPAVTDFPAVVGTQTAALNAGGRVPPSSANTANAQTYDGSSWTASTAIPKASHAYWSFGTQTAAIFGGGAVAPKTASFLWDGTSWTTHASAATGSAGSIGAGTQAAGMKAGGSVPPLTVVTEELTETVTLKTITDS